MDIYFFVYTLPMENETLFLIFLVISLGTVIFILLRKLKIAIIDLKKRQTMAAQMARNSTLGNIHQFLGEFAIINKFDELITLSTTSRQASLDIMGVLWEEMKLVFIEFKKKGAKLTPKENKLRKIVEMKNVEYKVIDIDLPETCAITERELPKLRT